MMLFDKFSIQANRRSPGKVDLALRSWVRYVRVWRAELRRRASWAARVRAWRLGFQVNSFRLYDLAHQDASQFVPDFPLARRITKINGFWNPIIGNKLVLAYVAQAMGVPTPAPLGCIIAGCAQALDGAVATNLLATLEQWIARAPRLVFRPHWSGGGEGVFFVDRANGRWRINERPAETAELEALVRTLDRYLVTAYVQQAAYARTIFPRTANTIRVLTLRDDRGPFIAAVVHRFGSSRSFPVDTFHAGQGGVTAPVDISTGVLGPVLGADATGQLVRCAQHPETGAAIEGVTVPHLHRALDGMLLLCHALPEAQCVGWDAVITDEGFSILEANSIPSLEVWQVHEPLLAAPRTAAFFAAHGIAPRTSTRLPVDPDSSRS
jgi:hypothetical protein